MPLVNIFSLTKCTDSLISFINFVLYSKSDTVTSSYININFTQLDN